MSPFERLRGAHLTNHPIIEDLIFSVLSLFIVAIAFVAITQPQQPNLAIAAQPLAAKPGTKQIQVYGTLLDGNGMPIVGATVEIFYDKNGRIGSTTTGADGSFTMRFLEYTSPYTIKITAPDGTVGEGTLDMTSGMKWGVQIVMTDASTWAFVPIPGY